MTGPNDLALMTRKEEAGELPTDPISIEALLELFPMMTGVSDTPVGSS